MRAQSRHQSAHQKAQRLILEFAHLHHADMEGQAKCRIRRRAVGCISLATEWRWPDSEIHISSSLTRICRPGIKELDIQVGGRPVGRSPELKENKDVRWRIFGRSRLGRPWVWRTGLWWPGVRRARIRWSKLGRTWRA